MVKGEYAYTVVEKESQGLNPPTKHSNLPPSHLKRIDQLNPDTYSKKSASLEESSPEIANILLPLLLINLLNSLYNQYDSAQS